VLVGHLGRVYRSVRKLVEHKANLTIRLREP
jgi:hypothetical protein